jgi:hypothetical protein
VSRPSLVEDQPKIGQIAWEFRCNMIVSGMFNLDLGPAGDCRELITCQELAYTVILERQ